LLPGQVVLHVTPDPLDGVQLRTVGREPYSLHVGRLSNPLSGMGPTGIQEQAMQTVGKRLRQGVDDTLEGVGVQIGPLQEKPLARGRSSGAIDVEPVESMLDQSHGLDPRGRQSTAAHGQEAHTTRQGFLCDWGAGPRSWP
jgi:hypothetical protein